MYQQPLRLRMTTPHSISDSKTSNLSIYMETDTKSRQHTLFGGGSGEDIAFSWLVLFGSAEIGEAPALREGIQISNVSEHHPFLDWIGLEGGRGSCSGQTEYDPRHQGAVSFAQLSLSLFVGIFCKYSIL